jgi:hypothetical protein
MSRKYIFYVSILLLFGLIFGANEAYAHDWYSAYCCAANHCHPINSCSEIVEEGKYLVWEGIKFTKDMVMSSHDNQCHVCIVKYFDESLYPKCIYIQNGS